MQQVLSLFVEFHQAFLRGAQVTLLLALVVWSAGLVGGTCVGAAADRYRRGVGLPLTAFSFVLSAIPVLVILFWAHFPLQAMLGQVIDPFITAASVLSLVNLVAVADLLRTALRDLPSQYETAALVCGLDSKAILFKIRIPLVLRQIAGPLLIIQVTMLQSTLFAGLISVEELLRVSQQINATAYKPVEIYTAVAIFFLAICLPLNLIAVHLKRRFTRDFSEA